jgi:hypothetical protein
MLIKGVTKPRVVTKFVIVEADLIYVSIKLESVRTTLPGKKPLCRRKTHNKMAAQGSTRNVQNAQNYFDNTALKTTMNIQLKHLLLIERN